MPTPDDPIILEPPPPVTGGEPLGLAVNPVKPASIKWYKRWSTQLAGINFAAVVAFYAMLPDRMLDAIPAAVHGLIGISLLATGLIPAATSAKQKKPTE